MTILEFEKSKDVSVCFELQHDFNVVIVYAEDHIEYSFHYKNGASIVAVTTNWKGKII